MAGVEDKAKKAVPADCPNPDAVAEALKALLIACTRKAIEIKPGELAAIAKDGKEAVEARISEVKQRTHVKAAKALQPSPAFSEQQEREVAEAALLRKDAPVVLNVFGDNERIYLRPTKKVDAPPSITQEDVDYYLWPKGYRITDYSKGYATDEKGKQQFRIGKLLKDEDSLYQRFMDDSTRTRGNLLFVISRNTADIASMSTGRAWRSCLGSGGGNWEYVPKTIQAGSLIAYMISEKDPDILNPLARILIRPFHQEAEGQLTSIAQKAFGRDLQQIFVAGKTYGLCSDTFSAAVKQFAEEKLNQGKEGKFRLAEGLYEADDERVRVTRINKEAPPGPGKP
jgi:hypothetical protein